MRNYSLTSTRVTLYTASAVVIQFIGLSLFMMGFFPVKPTLSGMSGLESFYPPGSDSTDLAHDVSSLPPENIKSLYQELSGVPPPFDRLILMVIDGLPAEFVLGRDGKPPQKVYMEAMPYTQSLLVNGLAIGYHAKAAPPTVTMPRLKAIVSGAIGGFLDVAFNFNTQAFLDDNLIVQFLSIGWKMVMLGDETWLKLFPNMFNRHDGVSSFFVKDTIQVDYNVSRHLNNELKISDWDLLILHYLGLDHVGHIGGRNSILMGPKLTEMDEVIKKIHSSFMETNERTLLMVVSDHGMTESGNHGGSSYAETDSLALFVGAEKFSDAVESSNEAHQVDIAVTLALLFGVPIPRNNVGTVMPEVFSSLEADDQKLRILQINSWQLMRLLKTHLTESECRKSSCVTGSGKIIAERLCCSYLDATALHETWESKNYSRPGYADDFRSVALAYHDFLRTATEWLSSRATDKPVSLLASGIAAMLLSCLGLMSILLLFNQDIVHFKSSMQKWHLDEIFVLAVILILIVSMGSSSMVEEEQYIWPFMTSSLYLILLRRAIQSFRNRIKEQKARNYHQIYLVLTVLVCGRILRGWHQGGVNWSYLPDISKFLEQLGSLHIKSLQLLSAVLVIITCLLVLFTLRLRIRIAMMFVLVYSFPVLLILKQNFQYHDSTIQIIYTVLGISTVGLFFSTPWLMPFQSLKTFGDSGTSDIWSKSPFEGLRDSISVIGWCYIFSWCLLQLILQQPVNSMPIALLLVQIIASIRFFSDCDLHLKQWVKVASLYYVGMTGHYGLGNTNTLATIDVAGAFVGISSHSTMISGILMFIITYASLMLVLLGMLMNVFNEDLSAFCDVQNVDFGYIIKMVLGYNCLVPLALNSILLLSYTIVLLLMQNHLFVWSVFSPKFLYVCATTACVYVGVLIISLTTAYTCMVFAIRVSLKRNRSTETETETLRCQ